MDILRENSKFKEIKLSLLLFFIVINIGNCSAFSGKEQFLLTSNNFEDNFQTIEKIDKTNKKSNSKEDSIKSEEIFFNIKKYFQNKNCLKAKENYLKLKREYYSEWAYPNSLEWLMLASYKINKYEICKYYCFEMLRNNFSIVKQKSMGMKIPAYNFDGKSKYFLAKIYLEEKQFDKCLYYIKDARYIAPDNYSQIDEQAENLNKAVIIAKCYGAKRQSNLAIKSLLQYTFCDRLNKVTIDGFYTHNELLNLLIELLKEKYTISEIQKEFNSSYLKVKDNEKYFELFDYEIPIYYGFCKKDFIVGSSTTIKSHIDNSLFYRKINEKK